MLMYLDHAKRDEWDFIHVAYEARLYGFPEVQLQFNMFTNLSYGTLDSHHEMHCLKCLIS